jgi:nucleoside-diphosphate-sugar epimerase
MPPSPLRLFIAGATGQIGREVARLGRAAGHRIVGLSRGGRPAIDQPWVAGIEWHAGDAADPDGWGDELSGSDVVVDALRPGGEADDVTERLFRCARRARVGRFVHVTASAALPGAPADYLERRRRTEQWLLDQQEEDSPRLVIVRLPVVYGPDRPGTMAALPLLRLAGRDRSCPPIPVGQAGMAILRASVEPDHEGIIDCPEAVALGHAVMIQS